MAVEIDKIARHLAGRGELCGYSLRGYIPCYMDDGSYKPVIYYGTTSIADVIPIDQEKGIQVGAGFDLGAYRRIELKRLGVPEELLKKLSRYTAHVGGDAMCWLRNRPFSVTPEQAFLLTRIMVEEYCCTTLIPQWNDAQEYKPFSRMSWQEQAVIFDVAHEAGIDSVICNIGRYCDLLRSKNYTAIFSGLESYRHAITGGYAAAPDDD